MFPQIYSKGKTNPGLTVDLAMGLKGVGLLASAQCDIWTNRIRNLDPCKDLLSTLRNNTLTEVMIICHEMETSVG